MADTAAETPVQTRCIGDTAIIYASDYLNKLSGERIERECKRQLESDVNSHTAQLFEMLGLTRHVSVVKDETEALALITPQTNAAGLATN